MKKTLLVIVSLCILAVPAAVAQTGNLGTFSLVLEDNFQWGITYQGILSAPNMLDGHRIAARETYTLRITFTASRDLEEMLQILFVDTSERANWWTELSRNDERTQIPTPIRAGQPVTATLTINTTARSTATAAAANALVFMTEGQGTRGRAGSGARGPVTLNFTEFVLTRN
jgi:hypothetical protein